VTLAGDLHLLPQQVTTHENECVRDPFPRGVVPYRNVFKAVLLVGILSADGAQELCGQTPTNAPTPVVIVAEGESFAPQGKDGWEVIPQDRSFASHTYGGMWVSQGGLLSVPARQEGAVAVRKVPVPQAGQYRVWSKYQAPPFFHYLHKIELVQGGKTVFSHVYGKGGTERLWSFSGESDELWWPWGIDHDAAEAPTQLATLAAGEVEIRLIAAKNLEPAGDRCLDFVLLTTNPANDYQGFKPYAVGSPFMNEAFAATKLYLRFKHSLPTASQLTLTRAGHFQPQYGGAKTQVPETAVAPGQWSAWVNIGPFCRLVHNEGITATLPSPGPLVVQVARDPQGGDPVGEITLASGESFVVPVDVTWNREAKVRSSREYAEAIVSQAKTWRTANGGKKAKELLFFGSFLGEERWVHDLKHALGYNTHLPEGYEQSPWRGEHHHVFGPPAIQAYAAKLKDKSQQRFISFGDEISLGQINFNDPKNVEKFRQWLKSRGVTASSLGVSPDQLTLVKDGQSPLAWYSNLFNEEERFAAYRESTEAARAAIGPHVLTGANYSPHHLALCYGPVFSVGRHLPSPGNEYVLGGGLYLQRPRGAADVVMDARASSLRREVPRSTDPYVCDAACPRTDARVVAHQHVGRGRLWHSTHRQLLGGPRRAIHGELCRVEQDGAVPNVARSDL
jgi:hypothetical protein